MSITVSNNNRTVNVTDNNRTVRVGSGLGGHQSNGVMFNSFQGLDDLVLDKFLFNLEDNFTIQGSNTFTGNTTFGGFVRFDKTQYHEQAPFRMSIGAPGDDLWRYYFEKAGLKHPDDNLSEVNSLNFIEAFHDFDSPEGAPSALLGLNAVSSGSAGSYVNDQYWDVFMFYRNDSEIFGAGSYVKGPSSAYADDGRSFYVFMNEDTYLGWQPDGNRIPSFELHFEDQGISGPDIFRLTSRNSARLSWLDIGKLDNTSYVTQFRVNLADAAQVISETTVISATKDGVVMTQAPQT